MSRHELFDAGLRLTNSAWVEEGQRKEIVTQGSGQKGLSPADLKERTEAWAPSGPPE